MPYTQGEKRRWRISIPSRFSANGKRRDLYYDTKTEAEADAVELRKRYAAGEILASNVITPDIARDTQVAMSILKTAGLDISLRETAQIAVERHRELFRESPSARCRTPTPPK